MQLSVFDENSLLVEIDDFDTEGVDEMDIVDNDPDLTLFGSGFFYCLKVQERVLRDHPKNLRNP